MAKFAADNDIPVLYRGQERPDDAQQETNEDVPEGPAKDYVARAKLKKSTVALDPQHHAGLGVSHYIQATSPIRRYMDLCHQRQFLSHFKSGKPWLTREQLEPLAREVENHLQSALQASRETKRFWLLRYLEQRDRKRTIAGTVVRLDGKSPLVELDEVYLTVFIRTSKQVRLGDRLNLRISSLDPHLDYVRFEVL
jgi:exoribonuclease-2